MAEKCLYPNCLRGVDATGEVCPPCQRGLPPMVNSKSPHAWDNPNRAVTTGLPKGTKKPTSKPKLRIIPPKPPIKPKKPESKPKLRIIPPNWKTDKTALEIKTLQRNAIQTIFNSYWYGWPKGVPDAFNEIFKGFGLFLTQREKPSSMVGTPDIHTSKINARGKQSFALVMDFIYPVEKEAGAFRHIDNSLAIQDDLDGVSSTNAIEMIKHNGETHTFRKKDEMVYLWMDGKGIEREIPKWAIA